MPRIENRSRPITKKIRLTEKENEYIKKKIERSGDVTFQRFALNQLIRGEIVYVDMREVIRLRTAINRIGANINQIARRVNEQDEVTAKEMLLLVRDVEDLKRKIKDGLETELFQIRRNI